MVRYQLAKRQLGTHQVQERGDVSKTTKRIGNQKGGGTARHGNGSVSQFRGGAKAHGPRLAITALICRKRFVLWLCVTRCLQR